MSRRSLPIRVLSRMSCARGDRRRPFRRLLRVEHLEVRCLMAADLSYSNEYDPNQILIELAETANPAQVVSEGSQQIGQSSWWTVPVQGDVESTVAMYEHLQGVVSAMPDYVVELADHNSTTTDPNDRMFQDKCLWGLDNHTGDGGNVCGFTSGTNGADINALDAWSAMRANSTDVIVAVIDTGVDYNHPDLAGNIWTNTLEIAGNGKDDDGNGYVDDVRGWDFVAGGDNDPMDLNGHGTHVSGTIGAVGNNNGSSTGMVGVAYNNVSIMPLRVFDANGSGKTSSVIAAINYAVANGAKISNNSYTIGGLESVVANATKNGHLFIAAAGNSGTSRPQVPASYQPAIDGVISVAASTRFDTYASFTSYGSTVDLAAPGDLIWSTFPLSLDTGDGSREGYRRMSGTSMASPHVVGVAALIWARNPILSSLDVKARILDGASRNPVLSPRNKFTVTNGRLNAALALMSTASGAPSSGGSVSSTSSPSNGHGQSAGNEEAIAIISFQDILLACPVVLIQSVPEPFQQRTETDDSSSFLSETGDALQLNQTEAVVISSQSVGISKIAKDESQESTADKDHDLTDSVFANFDDWTLA